MFNHGVLVGVFIHSSVLVFWPLPTTDLLCHVPLLRPLVSCFRDREHSSKLQDAVPASPYDEVDETVKEQLGRPLAELFATVDREALASASVAQVHRCTLKDGRKAVVKVCMWYTWCGTEDGVFYAAVERGRGYATLGVY